MMGISVSDFGISGDGTPVRLYRLENGSGAYAEVISYGCAVRSVAVPDRDGALRDVCLGFDTAEEYGSCGCCAGAVMGRCTNRIRGGRAVIGGRAYQLPLNDGALHIHGGFRGFDKRVWDAETDGDAVVFSRLSPDGEEGYPGALKAEVRYSFTEENELRVGFSASADADTIVNMTSHVYWNLDGGGAASVGDHTLWADADGYAPLSPDMCPDGRIADVTGTPFDFRAPRRLGQDWDSACGQIALCGGYDHNLALNGSGFRRAAELYSENSGIAMELFTTQPGLQVYTSNGMTRLRGKGGAVYGRRCAVALEAQGFPNAVNCPAFPSVVLRAGETYSQKIVYALRAAGGAK